MKISIVAAGLLCIAYAIGFTREHGLYYPLEIQKACEKNTRSMDGKPGESYWQNRAEYTISVEVDTATHAVIGSEEVYYYNNSPDTLTRLIIRLYPDLYRIGSARDFDVPKADITDGVIIRHLAINDSELLDIQDLERNGTNLFIPLADGLKPGEKLKLSVHWSYVLPTEFPLRGGMYEGDAFFVSYWYPQIAVYDDITGWDEYQYHGVVGQYNDFADFDVRITVPREFVVWATGELRNPQEVLSENILAKYTKALTSNKIVSAITARDRKAGDVTATNDMNTWHYRAENVTDFAFGASDYYLWDVTSLVVDRQTGRRAVIGAAYNSESKSFRKAAEICRKTIDYLSNELPGVPYPFPSFTAFDGSFAMEFPMMTTMKPCDGEWLFYHALSHEIVHSYFPFYTGTNERKYAFMDEGWAQMLPMAFQTREISGLNKGYDARHRNNRDYEEAAGRETQDRPPAVLSVNMDRTNYHVVNYDRPGAAYYFLQDMLGEELFRTALQEFMNRWHHKHPTPYDFYDTFNGVVGEDLGWYWKPWFFEFGYPDLGLRELKEENGQKIIIVEKKGTIPVPIKVAVYCTDGTVAHFYKTARAWDKGNDVFSIAIEGTRTIKRIELGDRIIPDVDRSDNILHVQ